MATNPFATDGSCPEGGLVPCLDRAVAGLPQITDAQIPSFVTLVGKWSDVLFKFYPDWFNPLFFSPAGHRALLWLPPSTRDQLMTHVTKETLMQFCLFFQSSIRPHPTDEELVNSQSLSQLFQTLPLTKFYEAIAHYVHPDQEAALSSLQSQFPIHFAFSPLHQQYTIPPEARPKLFPTINTALFSPQFDWLVHLLSKYSTEEQFVPLLDEIIENASDLNSPTLLQPDFSISDTFVHTNMFNSFDEFLSAKLPEVTPQLDSPMIDNPPLFSYFPNPHPCLPTPESRTPTEYAEIASTNDFQSHFVSSFLLGPSLFSQQHRDFYTSIDFVRYATQFNFGTYEPSLSFHIQLISYLYRTYLLTTDIHHLTTHLDTIASQHQLSSTSTSSPLIHTTPPTFTHPYFPLYLALGSFSETHEMEISVLLNTNFIANSNIISKISSHNVPFIPLLVHILHHIPSEINPIDAYIIDLFQKQDFFTQFTIQAQVHDPNHTLGIFCDYFIARSYQRYLEGKDTLHQHLYHTLKTDVQPIYTLEQANSFHSLLLYPFPLYYYEQHCHLDKHIFLTIHAGFTNFTPPSATTSRPLELYQVLAPVRSAFISYLVNMTHLDSFFPPSERFQLQTMHQLIPYITNFNNLQFTSTHDIMEVDIPSSSHLISKMVATSFPTIRSILYDDLGQVHAISFLDDSSENDDHDHLGSSEGEGDDLLCQHIYYDSPDHVDAQCVANAVYTLQNPFEPSNFTPVISADTHEFISSNENVIALQSHQTTLVQNHLIKHFKALAVTDPPRVQSKLQQVLLKSDLDGLPSTYHLAATNPSTGPPPAPSQSANPSKSHYLPSPIHMPSRSTRKYRDEVADWSLELLIVCLLDLHPQLLGNGQNTSSTPSSIIVTNAPSGQLAISPTTSLNNPSTPPRSIETAKTVLLPRLHQLIMSILHLPSYSEPNTVQADLYDTMISCTLSPMLRIFDALATLSPQPIEPTPPAP